jgi:16S rRNA processing protein RimM
MAEEKIKVGRITAFHGVKGFVKMSPYFDFPARIHALKRVFIGDTAYNLAEVKGTGPVWLVKFAGVDTREDAEPLMGKELSVPREERYPLPDGSYYVDDIVGLDVYEDTGRHLGRISEVLQTGANDIYVINSPGESAGLPRQILFPALQKLVVSFSLEKKKIVVRIPEGLF